MESRVTRYLRIDFVSELDSVSYNDDVIVKNTNDSRIIQPILYSDIFITTKIFDAIKLADGTNTTFDGSNPDIRFADGGLM